MKELLAPDDTRDSLRKLGGLLLGLGVLMLVLRKGGVIPLVSDDAIGDFGVFAILFVTGAYLYGSIFTDRFTGGERSWQAVHSVFGLVFVPLALFQFIEVVDGSASSLNTFWIFGVTAVLAFYAGGVKGIRFHLLAGSLATIVAWSALWNELLGDKGIDGHVGVYRGLLGILSILLLAGALYLWRERRDVNVVGTGVDDGGDRGLWRASELLTGAGIAAVLACSLGFTAVEALSPEQAEGTTIGTNALWDILLLVISLGLIGLGSRIGTRGPVYVGAVGLFLFLVIAGLDLDSDSPDPRNLGIWPIVLLVGGGLLIAFSSLRDASLGDQPKKAVQSLRGK